MGAINDKALSGVKVRSGNIQVGENDLFRSLFKQERFNSWCIGEFHIIHNKIKPNGRRDGFEHNKFYYTFLDHLKPTLTEISKIIEDTSRERNLKDKKQNVVKFSSKKDKAIEKIESILKKNSVDSEVIKMIRSCIEKEI